MIDNSFFQYSYFDAFINILGIIGTWPAITRLCQSRSPTPLESKLKWLLIFLSAMMLVRVPYVGFQVIELGPFVYIFAIFSAYSVFLYLETLMRKHLPLWTKIYISIGSLYFVGLSIGQNLATKGLNLLYFAFFIASMAVMALFIAFFRNRDEHTRVENSLIDQLGLTIILLTPLLLTDIFSYGFVGLPRFGVCGILIMTYFSLYNHALFSDSFKIFKKIIKSAAFSGLLTFAIGLLSHGKNFQEWNLPVEGRTFVLFFIVNLVFRIHYAAKQLDGEDDAFGFLKFINESKKSNMSGFMKDLNSYFGKMDRVVVNPGHFKEYDTQTFIQIFLKNPSRLYSTFDLKLMLDENEEKKLFEFKEIQAIEQMIHLLEKNEMTYILQIGQSSPHYLLFNVPMAAYREMIDIKSKIISDISNLIEKKSEVKSE